LGTTDEQPALHWDRSNDATTGRHLSVTDLSIPDVKKFSRSQPSVLQQVNQGCSPTSNALLVNGFFRTDRQHLSDMRNVLVAATMSNDAYPFAKDFGIPMLEVVPGLNTVQASEYPIAACNSSSQPNETRTIAPHDATPPSQILKSSNAAAAAWCLFCSR
jgi:hypothetical protein